MHEIAERIASKLLADLKSGRREVIGIGSIQGAILSDDECPDDRESFDRLEKLVVRKVVESVG
jgi:hypothetical protein